MAPNANQSDVVYNNNSENPQTPAEMTQIVVLDEPPPNSPIGTDKDVAAKIMGKNPKSFMKLPSWREIKTPTGEPDFNVAILIDDIHVLDRHASAMSKPASRCFLTHVVVLNSSTNEEKQVQESVKEWLRKNKIDLDVQDLDIGQGMEGYSEMLKEKDVDAVYIVLSPR
jgi:hypothetical protein